MSDKNQISTYVSERDDILIKNKYEICKNCDDFHYVLYFINDYKYKIIVRRLDSNDGWGQDLKVKVFSMENNDNEEISIGSSKYNLKIMEIYSKIKLFPESSNNLINIEYNIPKVIIQTGNDIKYRNHYHYNSIMSILEQNPSYEYKFMTDSDCRLFIKNNFPVGKNKDNSDILKAYDLLIPGKLKSELFRYCYLYINGGCYINNKIVFRKSLDEIIGNNKIVLCKNGDGNSSYYNGLICIERNNDFMHECIKNSVLNILESKEISANSILYNCFKNYEILDNLEEKENNNTSSIYYLEKNNNNLYFNNNILCNLQYKDYRRESSDINHIYFKEIIKIDNYSFYIYPYDHSDKFTIIHLKYNIFVAKRTDASCGWALNLKIRCFNDNENIIVNINIGNSDENEKIFLME
jgi:hypothetical protein